MRKITAIRTGRGQGKRVNLFLDGKFAFNLEAEVAIKENLQVEQELTSSDIEALVNANGYHRCLNAAIHYLSYRPRSETELRERLNQRGFDSDNIKAVISRLRELGLVDDVAFAQFWKENRESFSPRSRGLTRLELSRKGIANNIIDQVVNTIDDDDNAYQAAQNKAHSLFRSDYESFRRRLGGHLKRRGFNYGVIDRTVRRVWQEYQNNIKY